MKTVNGSFAGTSSLVKSVLARSGKQFKDTLRNWDDTYPVSIESFAENMAECLMANAGYPDEIGFNITGNVVAFGYANGNSNCRFGNGMMFAGPALLAIDVTDALKPSTISMLKVYGVERAILADICDASGQVRFTK